MERNTINVTTIEITNKDLTGDIALQALNIKREGGLIDVYFLPDSNVIRVKYENLNNNLKDVLASWGKEISTDKETVLYFNFDDLKDSVRNDIDKVFQEEPEDNHTGEIIFQIEE